VLNKYFPTLSKIFQPNKKSVPPLQGDNVFWNTLRQQSAGGGITTPYSQAVWVYSALSTIANNISQVPLKFYTGSKDKSNEVTTGKVFDLFNKPNPYMSIEQLIEITLINLGLYGEAFWILDGRKNVTQIPSEIWTFNPTRFAPVISNGMITGWTYINGSKQIPLQSWEVIHFKHANPYDDIRGLSPLEAVKMGIDQDYYASRYNSAFFANGATVGGFISSEKNLTDDQFKRLVGQFENRHKGESKAHKIGILEGGMKFIPTRLTQKDMDFIQLKKLTREEIFAAFKVNSVVLGLYEDVKSYEGMKTAHKAFWQECLIPKMNLIVNTMWHVLLNDIDGGKTWAEFDLSGVSALQDDFNSTIINAEKLKGMGFDLVTINERLKLNMPDGAWTKKQDQTPPVKSIETEIIIKSVQTNDRHILDVYLDRLHNEFNADWLFGPIEGLLNSAADLKTVGDRLIEVYLKYDKALVDLLASAFTASYLVGEYESVLNRSSNLKSTTKASEADYKDLPFAEAIEYFKNKLNKPSNYWYDFLRDQHSRAFVVAGATHSDLLSDLRSAVEMGLTEGTTLTDFRKDFDRIVAKYGWDYKGTRGFRTDVIFNTNISTAYSAGQYKQSMAVIDKFPIWRYKTAGDTRVRPLHASWNGVTLRHDDPFWNTHYPPNGWGCRCYVTSFMKGEVPLSKAPDDGTYEWINPNTGKVSKIPNGIDAGWDYNVGEAWGKQTSEQSMSAWKATGEKRWKRLTEVSYKTLNRPENIVFNSIDIKPIKPIKPLSTVDEIKDYLISLIGADEKIFNYPQGDFNHSVIVNAEVLSRHLDLDKTPYLPFLIEALNNPYEIWSCFEQDTLTGKVELRERLIAGFDIDKDKGLLIVFQSLDGRMESWTMIPTSDKNYINNQRVGNLIWKKD